MFTRRKLSLNFDLSMATLVGGLGAMGSMLTAYNPSETVSGLSRCPRSSFRAKCAPLPTVVMFVQTPWLMPEWRHRC